MIQEVLNCKDENGKPIDGEKFNSLVKAKYGRTDFSGLKLRNANGDINPSSLAYRYTTDRMTYIRARTITQTFYQVNPSDYVHMIPGEGAFSSQIITQASIKFSGSFRSGKISSAGQNSKLQISDGGVVPFYTQVQNWAMGTEYSVFDVHQALFMGQWDPIEAKQKARKIEYDLGIQEIAFLGDSDQLTTFPGLFTQPQVNINTTLIGGNISAMSTANFMTFVQGLLAAYLVNCNQTVWPDTFIMPQDDYAGMATAVSQTYPNLTMLGYLQQAFDKICPKKVKILPSYYAMTAANGGNFGIGKQCYLLYNNDIDTCFMELPVDFVTVPYGTYNNFNFQDAAYAQYTGVQFLKPLEALMFTHS
jgi:hypothetical protein